MSKTTTAGEYLVRMMDRTGVTPGELAKQLGLASASNISDWRSGARQIPKAHINNVAKYTGANRETLRNKVLGVAKPKTRAKALPSIKQKAVALPPGTNVTWIDATVEPAPADRAHVVFNNTTKKVQFVSEEKAVLMLKEAASHWAEFGLPNPPTTW